MWLSRSRLLRKMQLKQKPKRHLQPAFYPSKKGWSHRTFAFFFDPLGFSKVGDKEGFRNLRLAEIKYARVAMMATCWPSHPILRAIPRIPKSPDRRWCRDIQQWHHRFRSSVRDFSKIQTSRLGISASLFSLVVQPRAATRTWAISS